MSQKQNDIHIENLIQDWRELAESWDGKSIKHEEKMNDVAAELMEFGINVEDLE